MLTSIVGINWGDEGKGRMVDLLSENKTSWCAIKAATTQDTPSSTTKANSCSIFCRRQFCARTKSTSWETVWSLTSSIFAKKSQNSERAESSSLPKTSK